MSERYQSPSNVLNKYQSLINTTVNSNLNDSINNQQIEVDEPPVFLPEHLNQLGELEERLFSILNASF